MSSSDTRPRTRRRRPRWRRRLIGGVVAVALLVAGTLAVVVLGDRSGSARRTIGPRSRAPATTGGSGTPNGSAARGSGSAPSPFSSVSADVAGRMGVVTAAVYDDQTKRTWVLAPGIAEDTASIVKVEIMGDALEEAQATGLPVPDSEALLMPSMIENSDNDAATSVLADVGGPSALGQFDRLAGMTDTAPSTLAFIPGTSLPGWGLTTTTASDEVTLVSRFAYPNPLLSDASRRYGLSLMEHVERDQAWGVSAGVPPGVTVALKNGWLPIQPDNWQVNSVGWIAGQGRNYVLAVLTTGNPSELYGIATIETVARAAFANLNRGPHAPPTSTGRSVPRRGGARGAG